ncbi:MAG: hypothetical protein AAGI14_09625 [Pseudomonadota bacterium]
MKKIILGFCALFAPVAAADPVTAQEAMKELRDRGAYIHDSVLIFGEPLISAEFEDQGYRLVLSQCAQPDFACNITIFSACQTAAPLNMNDLMQFANEQNKQATARGTVYTDRDGGIGDVICIRSRRDLHTEDVFDMADVFAWHIVLNNFSEAVEKEKRRITVRGLLGIDESGEVDFAENDLPARTEN